jgi:hypothetical protein
MEQSVSNKSSIYRPIPKTEIAQKIELRLTGRLIGKQILIPGVAKVTFPMK